MLKIRSLRFNYFLLSKTLELKSSVTHLKCFIKKRDRIKNYIHRKLKLCNKRKKYCQNFVFSYISFPFKPSRTSFKRFFIFRYFFIILKKRLLKYQGLFEYFFRFPIYNYFYCRYFFKPKLRSHFVEIGRRLFYILKKRRKKSSFRRRVKLVRVLQRLMLFNLKYILFDFYLPYTFYYRRFVKKYLKAYLARTGKSFRSSHLKKYRMHSTKFSFSNRRAVSQSRLNFSPKATKSLSAQSRRLDLDRSKSGFKALTGIGTMPAIKDITSGFNIEQLKNMLLPSLLQTSQKSSKLKKFTNDQIVSNSFTQKSNKKMIYKSEFNNKVSLQRHKNK